MVLKNVETFQSIQCVPDLAFIKNFELDLELGCDVCQVVCTPACRKIGLQFDSLRRFYLRYFSTAVKVMKRFSVK
jgi:hypothetical protein